MFCNVCKVQLSGEGQQGVFLDHYKTDWHRYNVKMQVLGGAPISEDAFQQKFQALKQKLEAQIAVQESMRCEPCRKTFRSSNAFQQHLSSKTHLKQVQGRPAPVAAEAPQQEGVQADAVAAASAAAVSAEVESGHEAAMRKQKPAEPIPPHTCLFCPRVGKSIRNNLKHMIREHGFFVPYVEYAIDLEGLMEYLGYKVGLGHVCLWCNGRGRASFGSLEAVQQHMITKSHCRMRFDETLEARQNLDEDDDDDLEGEEDGAVAAVGAQLGKLGVDGDETKEGEGEDLEEQDDGRPSPDEYLPFYRFPGQVDEIEEEGPDGNPAVRELTQVTPEERRRTAELYPEPLPEPQQTSEATPVDIAPSQELVLSDGSLIGHRMYAVVYRQNLRETKRSMLIQSLINRRGINQGQLVGRAGGRHAEQRSEMDRGVLRHIERSTRSAARQSNMTSFKHFRPQVIF